MSSKGKTFKELFERPAMTAGGLHEKTFEQVFSNGRLDRAIARVVDRPGNCASAWSGIPWACG